VSETRYVLTVKDGKYEADSLWGLMAEVLRHRLSHLLWDGEWKD
jgi:hypothetical protein